MQSVSWKCIMCMFSCLLENAGKLGSKMHTANLLWKMKANKLCSWLTRTGDWFMYALAGCCLNMVPCIPIRRDTKNYIIKTCVNYGKSLPYKEFLGSKFVLKMFEILVIPKHRKCVKTRNMHMTTHMYPE